MVYVKFKNGETEEMKNVNDIIQIIKSNYNIDEHKLLLIKRLLSENPELIILEENTIDFIYSDTWSLDITGLIFSISDYINCVQSIEVSGEYSEGYDFDEVIDVYVKVTIKV